MGDDTAVGWIAAIIIGGIAGWLVLEHLPFGPRGAPCTVLLDGVATFLLRLLRER
jgi:hypothetical protein